MILGLAGKTCSGKNRLIPVFEKRGYCVIDADQLGHQALVALAPALVTRFGTADRAALRSIVFADAQALADLEALTHPWIAEKIAEILAAAPQASFVINAALLHKMPVERWCRAVIWVQAPWWQRLRRARRRDGHAWIVLWRRLWAQRKLTAHAFGADVDIYIVENRWQPERAQAALERLLERL